MHPQTPPERRPFDSPELGAAPPPADRNMSTERNRSMVLPMVLAAILLAAIIALIILL